LRQERERKKKFAAVSQNGRLSFTTVAREIKQWIKWGEAPRRRPQRVFLISQNEKRSVVEEKQKQKRDKNLAVSSTVSSGASLLLSRNEETSRKDVPPLELPEPGLDLGPLLGEAAVPLADALGELPLPLDRQHLRDLGLVPAKVRALEVLFVSELFSGWGGSREGEGERERKRTKKKR